MSLHWIHVVASWAIGLVTFAALALAAAARHRAAKRLLARLESRTP